MIYYGKKVRLRAIEHSDLPRYVQWFSDPEICSNMAVYYPMGLAHEERWYEEMHKLPVEEQPLAIEVKNRGAWEHIGGIGFVKIDGRCRIGELGVFIGEKSRWNKGLGTDAVQTLLGYGFETLNLNRIWLRVYEYNRRAQRVYEKAGLKREGTWREAHFLQGRYWDVHLYSILRREWDALPDGSKER